MNVSILHRRFGIDLWKNNNVGQSRTCLIDLPLSSMIHEPALPSRSRTEWGREMVRYACFEANSRSSLRITLRSNRHYSIHIADHHPDTLRERILLEQRYSDTDRCVWSGSYSYRQRTSNDRRLPDLVVRRTLWLDSRHTLRPCPCRLENNWSSDGC